MPAYAKKIGKYWRVVEADGSLVKSDKGTPVDGGGHPTEAAAQRQATAINISQARKKGHKIPKKKGQ